MCDSGELPNWHAHKYEVITEDRTKAAERENKRLPVTVTHIRCLKSLFVTGQQVHTEYSLAQHH